MKEIQEKLIKMLEGYSFKELEKILNTQTVAETRGAIMDAMELYHKKEFDKWIEEN